MVEEEANTAKKQAHKLGGKPVEEAVTEQPNADTQK